MTNFKRQQLMTTYVYEEVGVLYDVSNTDLLELDLYVAETMRSMIYAGLTDTQEWLVIKALDIAIGKTWAKRPVIAP